MDHLIVKPGPRATVVLKDRGGNAVMVTGGIGKGRVIYTGQIFGYSDAGRARESSGEEWKLLFNMCCWVAGKRD